MTSAEALLVSGAKVFNIELTAQNISDFTLYCSLLLEWNEKMNLTAIKNPDEIAVKHFADSLSVLKYTDIKPGASIIDVGTGAGFPGIPLAIVRKDIHLTLLDSLNKRLVFLKEVTQRLGIKADIVHMRAEEASHKPQYRERFDAAVSRAVAPLNILSEYCLPFVKVGGIFTAMKGPQLVSELEESKTAIKLLGGEVLANNSFNLSDGSTRNILTIKKISKTEKKYPRHGSKISKKPL